MRIQLRFVYLLGSVALAFMLASSASAQCVADECPLGFNTNSRGQIGNGLPLPITARIPLGVPGTVLTGPPSAPGTGFATVIYDAGDRVAPKYGPLPVSQQVVIQQDPAPIGSGASVHNPATAPRSLMFPPGMFAAPPIKAPPDPRLAKVPVFTLNPGVFQVNTELLILNPRVGSPSGSAKAGGRSGAATITWCPGTAVPATPIPTTFDPGCLGAGQAGNLFGGLARYVATKNQFGGPGTGTTLGDNNGPVCTASGCDVNGARRTTQTNTAGTCVGTGCPATRNATVYINFANLKGADLPCMGATNPACQVAVSVPKPITNGVFGAYLGKRVLNPSGFQPDAIRTATIGDNGTIFGLGNLVTDAGPAGNGAWFNQAVSSWGLPGTTGMLTISVPNPLGGTPEIFKRSGYDGRNANGSGLLSIVGGALSNRTFSGPNANRTWITYWLPEPGALVAGASALMMLGGCHWLVRRRR